MTELKPYLREAAVTLLPRLTDEHVEHISERLSALANPYLLVSRLSDHTALVQGIPVRAQTALDADSQTWELVHEHVRGALDGLCDADTRVTAIDVRDPTGALQD